ncbi:UNVERIFIED_CONTAM: hypothetical protein RMT77_001086 [Armadillidium vulgare]
MKKIFLFGFLVSMAVLITEITCQATHPRNRTLKDLCSRAYVLYDSFDKDIDLAYHEKMALGVAGFSNILNFVTVSYKEFCGAGDIGAVNCTHIKELSKGFKVSSLLPIIGKSVQILLNECDKIIEG